MQNLSASARGACRSISRVVSSRAAQRNNPVRPTSGEWLQVRALSGFRIHVAPELPSAEERNMDFQDATRSSNVDFADAKRSYANKSNFELARSLLIFRVCAVRPIVANASRMYRLATQTVGHGLPDSVIRASFFKHFCGGENERDLMPVMERLGRNGVGAILDYAAEADVDAPPGGDHAEHPDCEAACDANAEIVMASIDAAAVAAARSRQEPFAACKFTGIGQPELLERLSTLIQSSARLGAEGKLLAEQLPCDPLQQPALTQLADGPFESLTQEERVRYSRLIARANRLAEHAASKGVKLLIDAEQTYMQPAIDHLALCLMQKHNSESAIIFNTYQCYLKDAPQRVARDMERAAHQGFIFAAKAVRGAYLVQERRLAAERGYDSPIHDTKEDTHACYDGVVDQILSAKVSAGADERARKAAVMVASHNEDSIIRVVKRMGQLNLEAKDGIYFAQLQGMCDHVSSALGQEGYSVYKYLPYGPVNEVMPYLLRRLEENSDIMGAVGRQRRMIWTELKRRLLAPLFGVV